MAPHQGSTGHYAGPTYTRQTYEPGNVPVVESMNTYLGHSSSMCVIFWTASSEFGTYRLCEHRRFRRDCADAVSPEPPLLAHTSSESRGTFRQKARSLAPLNGWACAVKICHDGMLEDTNSLDGALLMFSFPVQSLK